MGQTSLLTFSSFARAAAACFLAFAFSVSAKAEETGPRPPRLTDLNVRSALVVGGELGRMNDLSGLSLPISARVQISPELVLEVEVPFGYVDVPGRPADPVVGNLGVGFMGSAVERIGRAGHVRWGLQVSGRVPTAPSLEDGARAARVARLRAVTPQLSERWSPDAAAVRVDAAAAFGSSERGVQLQAGATASLPTGAGPAAARGHWGISAGHRVYRAIFVQAEVIGAQMAPGATGERAGHYVTAAAAARLALHRVSPVFWISFPVLGDVEGDRPLVIGVEIASW
jgi:hypothetical protein